MPGLPDGNRFSELGTRQVSAESRVHAEIRFIGKIVEHKKSAEDTMKIKFAGGSAALAISMLALSGTASADYFSDFTCADRASVISQIETLADEVRCTDSANGIWGTDLDPDTDPRVETPIWQKGKGQDPVRGCEVHDSLAKALNEVRTGDEPPPIGESNGKNSKRNNDGNNTAAGAANDLRNGYDATAMEKLAGFVSNINNAKPSESFADGVLAAKGAANELVTFANNAYVCIDAGL